MYFIWLKRLFVIAVLLICALTALTLWVVYDQGVPSDHWDEYRRANVRFDAKGIPTLTSDSWLKLVEAQGYVVASERLWQMDLMRRAGAGRLSEWFGKRTVTRDIKHVQEDWVGVARRAAQRLPKAEREFCEAYARGVNHYIESFENAWSLEYSLLRVSPEPWQCRDSFLIMLTMADALAGSARKEAANAQWRDHLTEEWQAFLFPEHHPWARPLAGKKARQPIALPPDWQWLPKLSLPKQAGAGRPQVVLGDDFLPGSNAWVYRSKKHVFLANDPHLRYSVPQVWYANRLRVSKSEWAAGVSLPGIPGLVIGMNQDIAWGFTNLGEDVDDYLEETLSSDKSQYLAFKLGDREVWRRIIKKRFTVKVRNSEDLEIDAWFTHRGPLAKRKGLGDAYYSRQWIAFQPNSLGMPILRMNRAKNWAEFNQALDAMIVPAQAIVFADRKRRIGYRVSGVTIDRKVYAVKPVPATIGEWNGYKPADDRKRRLIKGRGRRSIALANAQIWESEYGHRWDRDDRRRRIAEVLAAKKDLTIADMQSLQLDTRSLYLKQFADWAVRKGPPDGDQSVQQRIQKWTGDADADRDLYTHVKAAESRLVAMLLDRLRERYLPKSAAVAEYKHPRANAWMLRLLGKKHAFRVFGIEDQEAASFVLTEIASGLDGNKTVPSYDIQNRLKVEHPLAGAIPLLGRFFRVKDHLQVGDRHLVRAERSFAGPSMRVVFDLVDISKSRWGFPIGQSGHVRSPFYRSAQESWIKSEPYPVLDPELQWQ